MTNAELFQSFTEEERKERIIKAMECMGELQGRVTPEEVVHMDKWNKFAGEMEDYVQYRIKSALEGTL